MLGQRRLTTESGWHTRVSKPNGERPIERGEKNIHRRGGTDREIERLGEQERERESMLVLTISHTVVEHYRNLWNFVRVLHEKEEDGTSICNPTTCPKMSAGK